ncbi:U3 small nucleolar RNA-associated 11 [Chlorella sorokiniana]|uniref:U3 small nucleolar RNA-associated protein 11 n=1 Tax=Chlorella sorokiniana TaxID=3076 RepID=A0A2P6U4E4_CHLSO|nr:U3 small nucleolar RNA-associated 11 [Chlorella sorokiniana]|eukprot:PRW61182.1 U3 small nucleolar RNA-associated 11 [Chlorella sorokiniana]
MGLKDAAKRKEHAERAQPAARRRLGLLEKKKDYLLRAKDFHKKEATLKQLRRKAEERNPDEFYFAMENARTEGGVHVARSTEANKYSQEELRLMKTQDVGYLTLKSQAEAKKVERLQQSLHLIGAPAANRHIVFVDGEEAAQTFDPAAHFDTAPELLDRQFNRPRLSQLADAKAVSAGEAAAAAVKRLEKKRAAAYRELAERQQRQEKLGGLAQELAYKKQVMGKGRKRKLRPEEAGGQAGMFKWKAERKR